MIYDDLCGWCVQTKQSEHIAKQNTLSSRYNLGISEACVLG